MASFLGNQLSFCRGVTCFFGGFSHLVDHFKQQIDVGNHLGVANDVGHPGTSDPVVSER